MRVSIALSALSVADSSPDSGAVVSVRTGVVRLVSANVLLREMSAADVAPMSAYRVDERYLAHYEQPPDSLQIFEAAREWAGETPRQNYQLSVTDRTEKHVVGCAGLRCADYPVGEGEVGVEIHPEWWGRGMAIESVLLLIELAQALHLTKLHAITKASNGAAIGLLGAAGFQRSRADGPDLHFVRDVALVDPADG